MRKRIKIGDIYSLDTPEDYSVTPDDRQEQVKLVGGVHVQDGGYVSAGDVISLSATFRQADWDVLAGYWLGRTKVAVTDHLGASLGTKRVVIKSYKYKEDLAYYSVTMELWNV